MIFTNDTNHNKPTNNKAKNNILFIFSYQSEGIILQQKIAILMQFIKELKENNLYVLSPYDNLKLVLLGEITRIQEKVSAKNIQHAVDEYHIDTIIPIDLDEAKTNSSYLRNIKSKKVKNFFSSYFELKQTRNEIENIMSKGGISTIRKDKSLRTNSNQNEHIKNEDKNIETNVKKQSACINITAIKDNFDNQIILDVFEEALANEKPLFCTLTNLSMEKLLQLRQKLDEIARHLLVSNYIYNIKLFVCGEKIYFGGLKYGICEETIFALQSKQISIASIMLKINNNIPIETILNKHQIVYAYDFVNDQKIHFAKSISEVENILPNQCKIQTNRNLISIFLKKDKQVLGPNFVRFNIANEFKLLKFSNFLTLDNYLFVCAPGHNLCIDLQLFFYTLIENLAKKTCKKLLLFTEQTSPMLSFLTCADIVYIENINNCINDIQLTIGNYKIKSAFLLQDYFDDNYEIATFLLNNNIKLLGYKKTKDDKIIFNKTNLQTSLDNSFQNFCKKIDIEYKQKISPEDYLLHYVGISDKYNNFSFLIRFNESFNGKFNVINLFSPNRIVDFRLNKLSYDTLGKLIDNSPFYGLFDITFLYKKGKLYMHKYSVKNGIMSFFLSETPSHIIYENIAKSLIDKNISISTFTDNLNASSGFLQKIAFIEVNNKIKILVDVIENKIYSKYIKTIK